MEKIFDIAGMHCQACIAKIKTALEGIDQVVGAQVTLAPPRAVVTLRSEVPFATLQDAVAQVGDYRLEKEAKLSVEGKLQPPTTQQGEEKKTSLYPLFLIVSYIAGLVIIAGLSSGNFTLNWLMLQFMAGFFITFSFFKLLDLEGFVSAFRGYDLIAKRFPVYGWSYPFLELALGIAYLTATTLLIANVATVLVMSIGAVGVFKVLLNKNSIQCACLGTALNLPMTKITLIENLTMVAMAVMMLVMY